MRTQATAAEPTLPTAPSTGQSTGRPVGRTTATDGGGISKAHTDGLSVLFAASAIYLFMPATACGPCAEQPIYNYRIVEQRER